MNKDLIEVGDIVNVYFQTSGAFWGARVLYVPQATGDCWHLRNTVTDELIYVQLFDQMILVEKYEKDEGDENVLPFTPY